MGDAEKYDYASPVAQLLTLGRPEDFNVEEWQTYLDLGLNTEHIPELIRMVIDERLREDDEESLEIWAPYHAWRALGQLHAEAAIEPLLSLYKTEEDNEWVIEEVPVVFGLIGPVALPALTAFMSDPSNSEGSRAHAARSIEAIAKTSPDTRSICVEILSKQLEAFQTDEEEFNASLITSLIDMGAKEVAPLMERAFAAKAVDESIVGDWDGVQESLGLLSPEELEQLEQRREVRMQQAEQAFMKRMQQIETEQSLFPSMGTTPSEAYWRQTPRTSAAKKAKHKDKISKQARKKNRKR